MKLTDNSFLIAFIGAIIITFILDYSRQKQMDKMSRDFKSLLTIVNSLKFRVFDHENQLLDRDGVYVPEDTGIFAFNLMWSILDNKTKKEVEEEYKSVCPSHIPLWKYFIYSYKIAPTLERKIEMKKIESVNDMIFGDIKETTEAINQLKAQMEEMKEVTNKVNLNSNEISKS